MAGLLVVMSMLALVSIGGIFGFFYAWVCSTMWGLDASDPRVAMQAMQAMNLSVRNGVFFPAFFGTPVILGVTSYIAMRYDRRRSAALFGLSALVYFGGAFLVTMMINVPMNEALAVLEVPSDIAAAQVIWQDYSRPWQFWNTLRTVMSGVALVLAGFALIHLKEELR